MSDYIANPQSLEPRGRPVGDTENSWCKAVSCGTGLTVLAIALSKTPDTSHFQNALNKLQKSHPILRSKLHYNTSTNTISLITPPNPHIKIKSIDISLTSNLLKSLSNPSNKSLSPFHKILEHELNKNDWSTLGHGGGGINVLFASLYALPDEKWVAVLRFHTVACDRTTAVSLLRELRGMMGERELGGGTEGGMGNKGKVSLGIESLIPSGKAKKTIWAHGLDVLSYSVSSLRLTNLKFKNVKGPRCSEVVRLKMNANDTQRLLAGCKSRGIKLFGALAAAGLIVAHSSKRRRSDLLWKKYGVTTLIDCRSILDPPLSSHNYGFYHSAILNTHIVKGGEKLWDLAMKSYLAFENSKNCNKHFSDLADMNFLMCRAIENPSLTSSSSSRTSLLAVFEDPVIDGFDEKQELIGLEDYMGCASVHGLGPSIGLFDTIRDGQLDCACVYPSPLHSRDQMEEMVDNMKRVLVEGSKCVE